MTLRPYAAALLLSSLSAPVLAQNTAEEAPTELAPVIINANPFGRAADDVVQPVEALKGEELVRKRRTNIGETLEGETGVSTADFGPAVGRPVIRGQGGPRVQVLENGIASMDVSNVSTDHAVSIDPANAEQVEIIKGPATLIFGSGASAGVVNVVNNRLPTRYAEGSFGSAEFTFGDNASERNYAADLNHGAGGFMFHLDAARREADNFDIPGFADPSNPVNFGTLNNSAVETDSLGVSLSRIGDAGSFGIAISRYESVYGLPQEDEAFIDLEQTRVDLQGTLEKSLGIFSRLRARLGVNDYAHTEFEDPATPGTQFDNDEIELRVEAEHAPIAGFRGVFGVQVVDRDFSAVGDEAFVQPAETQSLGLFLVEEREMSWGRFEAGLRVEDVNNDPTDVRPTDGMPNVNPRTLVLMPERDFTPVSLSLGALFNLGDQHHLRAGFSRAQRAPAIEELYAFGPHIATGTFERGGNTFGKETAHNFDLTLDRHNSRWTWALSLYVNQLKDYIYLQEVDCDQDADVAGCGTPDGTADLVDEDGVFDPMNGEFLLVDYLQADARFYGAEAETAFALLNGANKLNVRGFADLVRGRLDAGGNLPRVTPARIGVGVDGRSGDLSYAVTLTRVQDQNRISGLESATSGFELLSADLGYTLRGGPVATTLFLRGRNLLDEDARRHTSFIKDLVPMAGRSLFAGVRAEF